jgi:hypothetical protein
MRYTKRRLKKNWTNYENLKYLLLQTQIYLDCSAGIPHCFPFWCTKTTYNAFFKRYYTGDVQMDRKMICLVVVSTVVVSLAACVSGSSSRNTPLYTLRMEQASSEMNFLPTGVNSFTYAAEKGYTITCNAGVCGHALHIESTSEPTCILPTCDFTCQYTCAQTSCQTTCYTCLETCPKTCQTCTECEPQP